MSMSRLSSLLVRDGLIGVKRMEQAFQRQVIYGGALDTILLEMGAITEDRLAEYLSLATGLPPADRNLLDYFDPRAVQVCPREIAEEFHVAPVAFDGDALRVLVMDPADLDNLEALATRIGAPIQPFVVPEFRFNLLVERLFGVPTPSRYMSLAAKQAAAKRPPVPEPKVIVEDVDIRRISQMPRTRTGPMSTDTVKGALEKQEQARRAASSSNPALAAISKQPAPLKIDNVPVPIPESMGSVRMVPIAVKGPESTQVFRVPWQGGLMLDPAPLEPRAALEALQQATNRDDIFHTLIRGVRSRTRYAATLVVQGEMAFGREAIHAEGADLGIAQVAVSLTQTPAFRTAVAAVSPYIGPVATGNAAADAALARMGGIVPPAALLMPVAIRSRVVALVYAHRGIDPVSVPEMADLLPLAAEAGLALSRLILRAKATGYGKVRGPQAPPPKLDVEELPPKRPTLPDNAQWRRAEVAVPMPALALGPDAPSIVDSGPLLRTPIDVLVAQIEAGGQVAAEAYDEALRRADETLAVLRRKLPGRLWVDRYTASPRLSRASQHGPLLALLVRLGERAVPLLGELIGSEDREVRYYATLACGEVRAGVLASGLVARLFDHDYGVRGAAIDALTAYPHKDLEHVMEQLRNALHGDAARARAAAHALGELRDGGSVPDLIATTERDHTTAEEGRRALVQITKQDFGLKAKKWRTWWEKNKDRPRIEWMLDALSHPAEEVRHSASEELKRLTGEYFGYHYDLPKREREEARAKWVKWWEEVGKRRFLKNGIPEHQRSTAVLPGHMPKRDS
jgi:type II secretion system (T2SS) protein E